MQQPIVQDVVRKPIPTQNRPQTKKRHRRPSLRIIIAIALLIILIGGSFLAYQRTKKTDDLNNVAVIIEKVSRHYKLPESEEPALATVTDKSKISTPFLNSAENGDKLLIYQDAKKIIIYRPSIDRIIDTGPVSIAPLEQTNQ